MPKTTRSVWIKIRLDPAEARALRAAAEAAGMTPSAYARRNVLDAASLSAIAQRLSAMPTRDDVRDDLTHLAQRLVGAIKPSSSAGTSATNPPATGARP